MSKTTNSPEGSTNNKPERSSAKKFRRQMMRTHRVTIMLNDAEQRALDRYLDKYSISNRSKLIRETLMMSILKRFDTDSPTLFDELPTPLRQSECEQ